MSISPISKKHPLDGGLQSPSKRQKTADTRLKATAKFKNIPDEILQSICKKYLKWPEDAENAAHTCKDLNRAVKFWQSQWATQLLVKIPAEKTVTLQKTINFVAFHIFPNMRAGQNSLNLVNLLGPKEFKLKNLLPVMTFDDLTGIILDTPVSAQNETSLKKVSKALVLDNENNENVVSCLVYTIEKQNLQKDYSLVLELELLRQIKYSFLEENQKRFPLTLAIFEDASKIVVFQENITGSFFEIIVAKTVMPMGNKLKLAMSVVNSLALLHNEGITHRNLEPRNILVDGLMQNAYITGFNSLYKITVDSNGDEVVHAGKTFVGIPNFLPPEFIKARIEAEDEQELEDNAYPLLCDQANDIWQLGINLAYLFFNQFCGIFIKDMKLEQHAAQIEIWKKGRFETLISNNDHLLHLVLSMLSEDPEERPNISTVSEKLIEIAKEKYQVELEPVLFEETSESEASDADEIPENDIELEEEV